MGRSYAYKWIGETYPGTSAPAVRRAVTKLLEEGFIVHGKTKARFKLTDEGKAKFFAPKPKKKKKKKVQEKKKEEKSLRRRLQKNPVRKKLQRRVRRQTRRA